MRQPVTAGRLAAIWVGAMSWVLLLAWAQPAPGEPLEAYALPGLRADVATLLMNGSSGGTLPIASVALPYTGPDALGLALWVEVDGAALLAAVPADTPNPAAELRTEIHAYVLAGRRIAGHLSFGVRLPMTEIATTEVAAGLVQELEAGGLRFSTTLRLDPSLAGPFELRLLVRDASGQPFALRTLPLGRGERAGTRLYAPLINAPPGTWIDVVPPAEAPPAPTLDPPAGVPVLDIDRPVHLRLPTERGAAGGRLRLRLDDATGKSHGEMTARIEARDGDTLPGLVLLEASVDLPSVTTGNYSLVPLLDGPQGQTEGPGLPVYLLGEDLSINRATTTTTDTDTALAWTAIKHLVAGRPISSAAQRTAARAEAAAAAAQAAEEAAAVRRRKRRVRALVDAERAILRRLADGHAALAWDATERLDLELASPRIQEQGAPQGEDAEELAEQLFEARAEVGEALAASAPESLVPLLDLHLEVHARHLEARRFRLAARTRRHLGAMAELYASTATHERAPRRAADALILLGAALETTQQRAAGRALYEQALTLDPTHPDAALRLAVAYERRGDHGRATTALERLLETQPDDPEARLRLAINLRRLGRDDEATALLRRIVDRTNSRDAASSWRLSLAYQELAKSLLDAGHPDQAANLLGRAVARLPGERRLVVLMAYALDRGGSPAAARAALKQTSLPGGPPSPRYLYRRQAHSATEIRSNLGHDATLRRPFLARALEALE